MHLGLTEESITQCDLLNTPHIGIVHKIWINIEEDRHINSFPSIESLFLEAETLYLAEVLCHLARRNAVGRHPNYIFVRLVGCSIECQCSFPR